MSSIHHTTSIYIPQLDDYPDDAGSVGRPCGGVGATATVGICLWGRGRRSGA